MFFHLSFLSPFLLALSFSLNLCFFFFASCLRTEKEEGRVKIGVKEEEEKSDCAADVESGKKKRIKKILPIGKGGKVEVKRRNETETIGACSWAGVYFFHCEALVFFSGENVDSFLPWYSSSSISFFSGMRHFLRLLIPGCREEEMSQRRRGKGEEENMWSTRVSFFPGKKRRYKNNRTLSQKGGKCKSVFFP